MAESVSEGRPSVVVDGDGGQPSTVPCFPEIFTPVGSGSARPSK